MKKYTRFGDIDHMLGLEVNNYFKQYAECYDLVGFRSLADTLLYKLRDN